MIIRQGIDSKALLVTFIRNLPQLILLAVAGAVFGSGLNLLIAFYEAGEPVYINETEYYIDFADGRLEAKDYYNDYTWNDVIATDLILGRMIDSAGKEYDRDMVKSMLSADILSDVRYLTITVKGNREDMVSDVSNLFEKAIVQFGKEMEEFDSIKKIEDNGVQGEHQQWFSWRMALLGTIMLLFAGIFRILLRFLVGDCFYTKIDVMKLLQLNSVCMLYDSKNKKTGTQERRLIDFIKSLLESNEKVYLLDASDGNDAGKFKKKLAELEQDIDLDALLLYEQYALDEKAVILVIVPFGKICREKITDEINNAVMHGERISGAVLTECDRYWMNMYYGKGVKA